MSMIERLLAALHRDDDEPWPDDEELPGARRQRGPLIKWTCDDGTVITDPNADCTSDDLIGVRHIGQMCQCVFAIRSRPDTLAYIQFDDGARCEAYTSDCKFD